MKLLKKTAVGQRRVYDIEVEDVHNFFANGVNVHNCATDGGVSVIKDDGTVVDSAGTLTMGTVNFDDDNGLWYSRNVASHLLWYSTSSDYQAGDGFGDVVADDYNNNYSFPLLTRTNRVAVASEIYIGGSSGDTGFVKNGLMLHQPNYTNQAEGMSALTTSTYNTGWMPGDIKLAALADTDDTDVTGSELINTDGSEWSLGTGFSHDGSNTLTYDGTGSLYAKAYDRLSGLTVGQTYTVSFDVTAWSGPNDAYLVVHDQLAVTGHHGIAAFNGTDSFSFTFQAETVNDYIVVQVNNATQTFTLDNISVRLADPDRSVKGKGLGVHGSITKAPVATGADVVAYSGFSASNYLEQPYNADLDFGTNDDFCVMGWVKVPEVISSYRTLERNDPTTPDSAKRIVINVTAGTLNGYAGGAALSSSISANTWIFFVLRRSGSTLGLWVDGEEVDTQSNSLDLSLSTGVFRVGNGVQYVTGDDHDIALLRISATAPTADQIRKIYEDEKVLFQPNAKATLTGSSDAVTALAHDPDTDLLHVGTSGGRSVFYGLRRVNETATAVTTAISAVDGLIVEQ